MAKGYERTAKTCAKHDSIPGSEHVPMNKPFWKRAFWISLLTAIACIAASFPLHNDALFVVGWVILIFPIAGYMGCKFFE